MMNRTRTLIRLLPLLAAFGCTEGPQGGGTQTGNPHGLPDLDSDLVRLEPAAVGNVTVSGEAFAALPAGGEVELVNVDNREPVVRVVIADDGSFQGTVTAKAGDRIRVQARNDLEGSLALYLRLTSADGPFEEVDMALDECLALVDGLGAYVLSDLPFPSEDTSVSLSLDNLCDPGTEVRVDAVSFRLGTDEYTVAASTPLPLSVAGGSGHDPFLQLNRTGRELPGVGFMFLDLSGATTGRRVTAVRWTESAPNDLVPPGE